MINLEVKEHCQNCQYFTPTSDVIDVYSSDGNVICHTIVRCIYHTRCDSIVKYLKQQVEKRKS